MKKSQIKELKSKETEELTKMLLANKEDLIKIMVDLKSRKLKNTALPANKKRIIAVIMTILHEKEMAKV